MRQPISSSQALFWLLSSVPACGILQKAATPAPPISQVTPAVGQVPDSVLEKLIRGSELIVLAIPLDFIPDNGFLNPSFQLGAKETWYNVKLAVDSVAKGKLKRAKSPALDLPAVFLPPPPFGRLASNEIVVQYPAVNFSRSEWSAAPLPVIGERAVFIFRKCWYCLTIRGLAYRGPYFKAHPLVAQSWGSKLDPAEWPRVTHLLANLQRLRKQGAPREGSRPEFLP